jgi:class 3 adenylate cyclase
MNIKSVNSSACRKCLQLSLPVETMIRFARLVNPTYDIYRRTGLREGMPVPNQIAAQRIVADMVQDGYFIDFVETLVKIDTEGYMGRRYGLRGLDNVITGLINEGYSFDTVSGQFFENQRERISPNWGRLQEGDERRMTLLRLDIAGNSALVKNNPKSKIEKAYEDIRIITHRAVTGRFGRLWSWEGDGALAAFLYGSMEKMAIFAGMEILHELFFYNRVRNPLGGPVNVRLGAHIGQVSYSNSELERLKNETAKHTMALEALASPNALSVSYNLYIAMDQNTLKLFGSEKIGRGVKYRLYSMGLEK